MCILALDAEAEQAEWDFDLLDEELGDILDIDMESFGFEFDIEEEPEPEAEEDDYEVEVPEDELCHALRASGVLYSVIYGVPDQPVRGETTGNFKADRV